MEISDLREFRKDTIVLHFGVKPSRIDAYTFANALIAFCDLSRSINNAIYPDASFEIEIEPLESGSVRAILRQLQDYAHGDLTKELRGLFWTLVAGAILWKAFPSADTIIVTGDDHIIIECNNRKVILPKSAYDLLPRICERGDVSRNLGKTFKTLETNKSIENFGVTPSVTDPEPLVKIDRADFPRFRMELASVDELMTANFNGRERREKKARLLVDGLWLQRTENKWTFEWNGIRISAIIADKTFLSKLSNAEHVIASGDCLHAIIEYYEDWDTTRNVWKPDLTSFVVLKVVEIEHAYRDQSLLPEGPTE